MVFDASSAQGPRDLESEVHAPRDQPYVSRTRHIRSRRRAFGEGRAARSVRQTDPRLHSRWDRPARTPRLSTHGAATILKVDRFGNLITNFAARDFAGITDAPV